MQQNYPTVEITTVYSAKGLQYDHVCLLQVGTSKCNGVRGSGRNSALVGAGVIESCGQAYLGVQLDPEEARFFRI